jgi:formylglycine-generating enzyme required for sulfatase activity
MKFTNSICMEFVKIPAGNFLMGSNESTTEGPIHNVTIRKPFLLGKYPVTQEQWKAVMGDSPSRFKGDELPVEQVSWNDALEFIKKLNQTEETDEYRLPSEAEWEYACRAGVTNRYCFGDEESKLGDYAWYNDNSGGETQPIGQRKPNFWGLHDMHGNIWEWVQDCWHENYNQAPSDGSAWANPRENGGNSSRVKRGGGWYQYARFCRSASRNCGCTGSHYGYVGFRLLRIL